MPQPATLGQLQAPHRDLARNTRRDALVSVGVLTLTTKLRNLKDVDHEQVCNFRSYLFIERITTLVHNCSIPGFHTWVEKLDSICLINEPPMTHGVYPP